MFDSEGNAKLADFGVSELYESSDTLQTTEGTYYFMAPELFGNGAKAIKGKAADIWALGVTFFCFIFLEVPFLAEDTIKISELIKNSVLKIPDTRKISKGLENLLRKMMEKDPEKRITLE